MIQQDDVSPADVQAALDAYQTAQTYDAELNISTGDWNALLWYGSLHAALHDQPNLGKQLLTASQAALDADPNNTTYRDTLGVAKVLSGDKRRYKSAIQDFEFYVANFNNYSGSRWCEVRAEAYNPYPARLMLYFILSGTAICCSL